MLEWIRPALMRWNEMVYFLPSARRAPLGANVDSWSSAILTVDMQLSCQLGVSAKLYCESGLESLLAMFSTVDFDDSKKTCLRGC
jgi:hypothetical protein